jgi:hypothetical protein
MDEIVNAFREAFPQKKTESNTVDNGIPDVGNSIIDNSTVTNPVIPPGDSSDPVNNIKPDAQIIDISDFNTKYGKRFGREIKEEKELEDIFSAPSKVSEYENKVKDLESQHGLTKKELEDLKIQRENEKDSLRFIDIKKYFANDSLYKTNEMLKKYPDKDISIMTSISNMDLEKTDTVDLLVKKALLDDSDIFKGMNDSQVKEVIADNFGGVDLNDPDSWDNVTKAKIAKAGKEIRNEFKALQNVELPVPVDVEKVRQEFVSKEKAQFEQTKQAWSPIVDKMISNFTELIIPDEDGKELYKYNPEINDSFKKEVSNYVDYLAYTGQPINEETITNVLESIKGRYIAKELPKIIKSHALKVSTQVNDEWHHKVNNDVPLSEKTAPQIDKNDVWSKMERLI